MKTRVWVVRTAILLPMLVMGAACRGAAQGGSEAGWVSLIQGQDLGEWEFMFGEEGTENRGTFRVEEGVLYCTGKLQGTMVTRKVHSDYTLSLEFAFDRPGDLVNDSDFRGNSGVLIHVSEGPGIGVWPRSVEVQGMHRQLGVILPIPRNLKCELTFDAEASARVRKPVGEWNRIEIVVRGGEMTISLNGVVVSTVKGCELTRGPIGLQSEGAPTRWRNIRIREERGAQR